MGVDRHHVCQTQVGKKCVKKCSVIMPQLDQFTYLTQIIWLTGSFLGYYVVLYKYGLPKLSRIFKLRARLHINERSSSLLANQGVASRDLGDNYDIVESIQCCTRYLSGQLTQKQLWCDAMVNQLNAERVSGLTSLGSSNKTYIQSLAEMSLSQNLQSRIVEKCSAQGSMGGVCASKLRSIVLIRIRQYCSHKPGHTHTNTGDVGVSASVKEGVLPVALNGSVKKKKQKQVKHAR